MQTDALVAAPVILAVLFAISGAAKLGSSQSARDGFDSLDVPRPFSHPWVRAAHPWTELLLAGALIFASGPMALLAAGGAVVLLAAYLWLILRALRRDTQADCACFGSIGAGEITPMTALRNVWLIILGGFAVWSASDGPAPIQRLVAMGGDAWWLASLTAAAITTALVVGRSSQSKDSATPASAADLEDYERQEIPHVPVSRTDGGTVSLRDLAKDRPQLLIAVSYNCYSCAATIKSIPKWRERLPELDVRPVFSNEPGWTRDPSEVDPMALHDSQRYALNALGLEATPSAVLLGADGMLAGGPVVGYDDVPSFIQDIEAELIAARHNQTS